jgi:hypothetical protein
VRDRKEGKEINGLKKMEDKGRSTSNCFIVKVKRESKEKQNNRTNKEKEEEKIEGRR